MPDEIYCAPDQATPDAWRVEDTNADGDGSVAVAIFSGFEAHSRALAYAKWLDCGKPKCK